jgi:hypothetical protein
MVTSAGTETEMRYILHIRLPCHRRPNKERERGEITQRKQFVFLLQKIWGVRKSDGWLDWILAPILILMVTYWRVSYLSHLLLTPDLTSAKSGFWIQLNQIIDWKRVSDGLNAFEKYKNNIRLSIKYLSTKKDPAQSHGFEAFPISPSHANPTQARLTIIRQKL